MTSLLILLPLLTAAVVMGAPERAGRDGVPCFRWIAATGTGLHLVLTAITVFRYRAALGDPDAWVTGGGGLRLGFAERVPWFESLGIQYFVGLDGLSLAMVVLTSIIIFAGVLASWNVRERAREFFALLLILVTGVFGVFLSFDLFLFFVFYEVAVLPMYLLIGVWGTGPKEYSAMKLTLMLLMGSALILVGFLALYHAGGGTFDLLALAGRRYPGAFQRWVFPMLFVGFGVIGALYPFHTWSPDGHSSAPTAVSMLHAGVLMKLGGYGALRVAIYLLPDGAKDWALVFMGLATINIVYGAFGAIMQRDLKYFTAYSSVSHCGFVLFGVATLNLVGMKGAILQMFSHGIMTGLFFALIGMVYGRTHTRNIPEMGGLARSMPWFAAAFYLGGLAALGLPGLSGFVAELHVFLGGILGNGYVGPRGADLMRILTVIATMSIVVTAVFVLRGLAQVFMGPVRDESHLRLPEASVSEKLCTGMLCAVLVVLGVVPSYFIRLVEPAVTPLLSRLSGGGS